MRFKLCERSHTVQSGLISDKIAAAYVHMLLENTENDKKHIKPG